MLRAKYDQSLSVLVRYDRQNTQQKLSRWSVYLSNFVLDVSFNPVFVIAAISKSKE